MPLPVGLIAYNKLVDFAAKRSIYADDPDANALLVGNGSSALQTIAPGTVNQVLVSNGSAWAAGAVPAPDLSSPGNIGGTTPGTGTFGIDDSSTNSTLYPLIVRRTTTGSAANNIGGGIEFQVETSTTANQVAGRISTDWSTVMHASRTSRMIFYLVNSAASPAAALTLTPTRATVPGDLWLTYGPDFPTIAIPDDFGTATIQSTRTTGQVSMTARSLILSGTAGNVDMRAGGSNSVILRTNNVLRAAFDGSGNLVINDTGTDSDVRIEGDTDQNLFVLDAGLDVVSIGEAGVSGAKLNVNGTLRADGLRLDLTPTMESLTPTHSITISINGTNYKIPLQAA